MTPQKPMNTTHLCFTGQQMFYCFVTFCKKFHFRVETADLIGINTVPTKHPHSNFISLSAARCADFLQSEFAVFIYCSIKLLLHNKT